MNLYHRYGMQNPQSRAALASRLVGSANAVDLVASVRKSVAAPNLFFRDAATARATVDSPTWASVSGLNGFGSVSPLPGVTFSNNDAYNDFTGGVASNLWHDNGGAWNGVPPSLWTATREALAAAQAGGYNSKSAASAVQQSLAAAAKAIDSLQPWTDILFGRSSTQDAQYRSAMQSFVGQLQAAPQTLQAAIAKDAVASGGGGGGADGSMSKPGLGGSSMLPIILGGVAVVGVIAISLLKKRSSAAAVSGVHFGRRGRR